MVLVDYFRQGPRETDILEDFVACLRMQLDQVVFQFGELRGLGQNIRRYGKFPYVVQGSRSVDAFDSVCIETHLLRYCDGQVRNPQLMARGIGVADLRYFPQTLQQPLEKRLVAALAFLVGRFFTAGTGLVIGVFYQGGQSVKIIDVFYHVVRGTHAQRLRCYFFISLARDHDYREVQPAPVPDFSQQFQGVLSGKSVIQKENVP